MAKGPLGKFVAERRKSLNLRQSDLAEALGYTTQAISKFEAGESQIAIVVLPNLANLLQLSLDDLFAENIPTTAPDKKNEKIDLALVANNLIALRNTHHLSLSEEAEIAHVSKRTIIHYERGDSAPSFDVLATLLAQFDVTPSLFFYSVMQSPEQAAVISSKAPSKKKWLIPVIALALAALTVGIVVPVVLTKNKAGSSSLSSTPEASSSLPVSSQSSSANSSSSSEASSVFSVPISDLSSDFPGLKALRVFIDNTTIEKELGVGTYPIEVASYPSNYFDNPNYTLSYSLDNPNNSATTLSGDGVLTGHNLTITAQQYVDDATNGIVLTLKNLTTAKTFTQTRFFTVYNPRVYDQTSFPGILSVFARNEGGQFISVTVGDTFTMTLDVKMAEGTTFDPSLYSIDKQNDTVFSYVGRSGDGTNAVTMTFKALKVSDATFYHRTVSFVLTNHSTLATLSSRTLRVHVNAA